MSASIKKILKIIFPALGILAATAMMLTESKIDISFIKNISIAFVAGVLGILISSSVIFLLNRKIKIFISYNYSDKEISSTIFSFLKTKRFTIHDVDRSLYGGERIDRRISELIENCNIFIFIISKKSIDSDWSRRELNMAFQYDKTIIPILIERIDSSNIPNVLRSIKYIDMNQENKKPALDFLYKSIKEVSRRY